MHINRPFYKKSSYIDSKTKHNSYAMLTFHLVFEKPNIAIGTENYEMQLSLFYLYRSCDEVSCNRARSMDSLIYRWYSNHGSEHNPTKG